MNVALAGPYNIRGISPFGGPSRESTGKAQNTIPALSPVIDQLYIATTAPATASVGSKTLSTSGQENPTVPASTSDEVEDEEEDGLDNLIVTFSSSAVPNFDEALPVLNTTTVASKLKNPLDKEENSRFDDNLRVTFDTSFDAAPDADAIGRSRKEGITARSSSEQLFKTRTKALQSTSWRVADNDANSRLLAGAMDGVLIHSEFLTTNAKEQVQANIILARSLADQRNQIKMLSQSVARVEAQNLSGQQSQRMTCYKVTAICRTRSMRVRMGIPSKLN
jgi:hypothetical protein